MATPRWMIYGATGYTGQLVAAAARARGMTPLLAGRNAKKVSLLEHKLELPTSVISLDNRPVLQKALAKIDAVLHCAGPFIHTSEPMIEACLATGTHYLDITGEIPVLEAILARGQQAQKAGVTLLPGVGFDVIPTDCLAALLAGALPDATHLALAFTASGGMTSAGTQKTMLESLPQAGAIRQHGKIVSVSLAHKIKQIPFSCGSRWAMTIPWGDVATAFHTTGIPNICVYLGQSRRAIRRARLLRPLLPSIGLRPVKRLLQWWISHTVSGPNDTMRATVRTFLWAEACNAAGQSVSRTAEIPEGYRFTAESAVESLARLLQGAVPPGVWTPSQAFGPDYLGQFEDVVVNKTVFRQSSTN